MKPQKKIKIARILSFVISISGIIVITGWIFDIAIFKSISPGWISMKLSTAFAFFLSGISLYFMAEAREGGFDQAQIALSITSLSIVLVMGTLFFSLFLGVRTGVDDLFIKDAGNPANTVTPGMPSTLTMLSFLLISLSGILTILSVENLGNKLAVTGFIIAGIGVLPVIGYIVNAPLLCYYIKGVNSAMAFHSAVLFVLLGAGLTCLSE